MNTTPPSVIVVAPDSYKGSRSAQSAADAIALSLLGAKVRSGAEAVADILGLDEAMVGADWVIAGEGRSDEQTLHGKAPYVVCQRARRAGVPATLPSGAVDVESSAQLQRRRAGCTCMGGFIVVPET